MKAKFLVFFIGLSLLISFNFAQAQITDTQSNLETLAQTLRQQIEDLKERILQLQEELKEITTELKEAEKAVKFTQNLHRGLRDKEVEYLQEFLSEYPEIYPEGLVTGYFGSLTERAVKKFQEKHTTDVLKPYGLTKGTGFVGEKTIAKINELMTEKKITICHYPPDNPGNRHTLVIGQSALEAHLAHGDTIGACEPEPEPEDVCPNIDEVQETIPEGMIQNNEGNCVEPEPGAVLGCTDETATNYNSDATQDDGTCVYPDITPPVISNFQPTGTITDLTPTLSLNTDENATCRYLLLYPILCTPEHPTLCITDQSFDAMLNTFSGAGATYHYATMGTMTAGTYTYYARCKDTAGNKNTVSASIIFTITTEIADTTAPVISNIQVSNITRTSATIMWQTNEESNSIVGYGLTTSYGSTASGETSVTYHEVNLTNLTDGTTYHYKVKSTDSVGNRALSSDKTFTTLTLEPEPEDLCPDIEGVQEVLPDGMFLDSEGNCVGSECTDSDGGKDYYVRGTTDSTYPSYSPRTDYCATSVGKNVLMEYFCAVDEDGFGKVESEQIICPNGNVCLTMSGVCVNVTCDDTDGGYDVYTKGTITGPHTPDSARQYTSTEYCINDSWLHEYYCGADHLVTGDSYPCPDGCQDGACQPDSLTCAGEGGKFCSSKTPTEMCSGIWFDINGCCLGDCYVPEDNRCYDSDGGANYYVKGYVETEASKFVKCDNSLGRLHDACYGDMLREYTCEESYLPYAHITEIDGKIVDVETTYTCPNGCMDGACLPADTTPPGEVTNFTATAGNGQVSLSWTNPTDADFTGAKILRKTGNYPTNITDGTQIYDGTGASHTDTGLANGTAYYYKAFAYDEVPNYSSGVGATATPTAPSSLTVRGRIVDTLTSQPVTNSNLYIWNWKGGERRDFYINSDGTFSIDITEDDIANASVMYVNSVYISGSACYDQSSFSISKNSDGRVDYIRVNGPGAYSDITYRTVQSVGSEIDLGDYLVWPVTGFKLTSDIPVKFRAEFENGSVGPGNSSYRTVHGMSTLCPIDVNTRIMLTDQSGNEYVSPYVKYPLSQHCSYVTLDYADGQFSWSPSQLSLIDRLLKDIQFQVAAMSAVISDLLMR